MKYRFMKARLGPQRRSLIRTLVDDVSRDAATWGERDIHDVETPFVIFPPRLMCQRVLLITKSRGLPPYLLESRPSTTAIVGDLPPCSRPAIEVVAGLAQSRPVGFIGDLDAVDIVTFIYLSMQLQLRGIRLEYVGVSDQWDWVRGLGTDDRSESRVDVSAIVMKSSESQVVRKIRKEITEIDDILGKGACTVLDRGYKLEIEGASSERIHGKGVLGKLSNVMFGQRKRG